MCSDVTGFANGYSKLSTKGTPAVEKVLELLKSLVNRIIGNSRNSIHVESKNLSNIDEKSLNVSRVSNKEEKLLILKENTQRLASDKEQRNSISSPTLFHKNEVDRGYSKTAVIDEVNDFFSY
jgi:hypothetical protein